MGVSQTRTLLPSLRASPVGQGRLTRGAHAQLDGSTMRVWSAPKKKYSTATNCLIVKLGTLA